MSGKKSTPEAKLETYYQGERLQKWKEHFKNILETPPKFNDKLTK